MRGVRTEVSGCEWQGFAVQGLNPRSDSNTQLGTTRFRLTGLLYASFFHPVLWHYILLKCFRLRQHAAHGKDVLHLRRADPCGDDDVYPDTKTGYGLGMPP